MELSHDLRLWKNNQFMTKIELELLKLIEFYVNALFWILDYWLMWWDMKIIKHSLNLLKGHWLNHM